MRPDGPIRLMPLGDSITEGYGDVGNGGYRGPLSRLLAGGDYAVDFVGSLSGGAIERPRHEGHSGWCADQITADVRGWLAANPPDIVLLHIGTNDVSREDSAAAIAAEIGRILNEIDSYETESDVPITVIVAQIVSRCDSPHLAEETTRLNAAIASMAAARIQTGDRLHVANFETALAYPADLFFDDYPVHPNAGGYAKMARVWFDALVPLLARNRRI
jgi:lysophospholipase L1-like esterase